MTVTWSRRLFSGATAVVFTGSLLAALQTSTAVAAEPLTTDSATLVNITNGNWTNSLLCAGHDDNHAWISDDPDSPYCQWEQIGKDGQFVFFNPAKGKVLSSTPGDGSELVMSDPVFPTPNAQSFSWGAWEGWGARSLQWFGDSGQNVDAGIDAPTTNPVRTRGWRHGNQRQLTWNVKPVAKPSAQVARSVTAVNVMNGLWSDQMLCAGADRSVRLSTDKKNPACEWLPFGPAGPYVLYNPQYGKVITYDGGNEGPLWMDNLAYPNNNRELFVSGGQESWGASALQWYGDSGQNVDAGIDAPTTNPVRTRGWRHGNQRQLTWNFSPVIPPTAVVTMGDSFMSGEGGRWQGNSNSSFTSRDGTDRAYTGWETYDPSQVYGASYANGCNRSDSSEAHSSGIEEVQINLACSGAETVNVFRAANGGQNFKGEDPQADQLLRVARRYDVRVIALSIGGNDLGFSDVISACIETYTVGGGTCHDAQQERITKLMPRTLQNVAKAINEIQATMHDAGYDSKNYRIILQPGPSPLPWSSEMRYPENTWERLNIGGCPVWNADADWASGRLVGQIADGLKSVAVNQKVDFLDLRDALRGREVCSKTTSLATSNNPPSAVTSEWARFLVSGLVQGELQESFHPNYYGQLALGKCLSLFAGNSYHQATCTNTPGQDAQGMRLTETSS